jgi:hypothetical protein
VRIESQKLTYSLINKWLFLTFPVLYYVPPIIHDDIGSAGAGVWTDPVSLIVD